MGYLRWAEGKPCHLLKLIFILAYFACLSNPLFSQIRPSINQLFKIRIIFHQFLQNNLPKLVKIEQITKKLADKSLFLG
ncbi:hypothetical protein B0680_07500 [Moraxella pluranimalium]|uniref:Uncharacterized protein n=1 Tax=Moraxella pluranimalium TaxID=470453 RepID=A0A1T0CM36_9GAMM|nr:hypothetical protein B0680_07500 [Moraxella pluranimalium]